MPLDQKLAPQDLRPINLPYQGVAVGVVNAPQPPPSTTSSSDSAHYISNPTAPTIVYQYPADALSGFPPPLGLPRPTITPPIPCTPTVPPSPSPSDDTPDDPPISGKKVKFLCSFGGKILPRPSDGMLRYVGGHTRIISVRRDVSLPHLLHKMSHTYGQPVLIKYQLPDEDLDALVSVSCPDDLVNMMEEYEKLLERSSDGSSKLRVFLFSATDLDPSTSVHLGDSQDTGQRYVDAVNGILEGITRKESAASVASTQNSDMSTGTPDNTDARVTPDVTSPPSTTTLFSPSTPSNDNIPLRAESPAPPLTLPTPPPPVTTYSQQPDIEMERSTIPVPSPLKLQHPPPRYNFQQSGLKFLPPPSPHLGAIPDGSARPDYQRLPPQMVYANPQMMGAAARPTLIQPQYRDNSPALLTQQFVPAVQVTMAPTSSQLSPNPNVVRPLAHKVVAIPADQSYNQAYSPQATRGLAWNQVTPQDHGAVSDGRMPRQQQGILRATDCQMCQKALPHAHSDTVAQDQLPVVTTTEVNTLHHSLQVDEIRRLSAMPPQSQGVTGLMGNFPATIPKDSAQQQQQQLASASQVKQEVLVRRPVSNENIAVSGVSYQMSEQFVDQSKNNDPTLGKETVANIAKPNEAIPPRYNLQPVESVQVAQPQLAGSPSIETAIFKAIPSAGSEAAPPNRGGIVNAPSLPPKRIATPELFQTGKGLPEEQMKQQVQVTPEAVVPSVVADPSLPPNLGFAPPHIDVSVPVAVGESNSGEVIQNKMEAMNLKPEKTNFGFPVSDGIGRLQIIKNSDLEELRELGSGAFGTVYHGKWRGTDVAIKRINERCFAGKPSEQDTMRDDFWNEAIKLAELHHPNVVAFYGLVLDGPGGSLATVTEYMVNGSLRTALQKNERNLDKRKRLLILMDVAFGMEYLHSKNIVHFDLKSDNLLVNLRDPHRPICKVGDLGLSKVKCQTLISGGVRGTLPWMAPELLNGSSSLVSDKVDVFSFGIVMWELLTGEEPYSDLHYGAIIGGIVSNTLRPGVPESCDPEWRALMERCWSAEPGERPSFTQIANELRSMSAKVPLKGQVQGQTSSTNIKTTT